MFISGYANTNNIFYCLNAIFPPECGCPKAKPVADAQYVDFICDPVDGGCKCPDTENGRYTPTENGCLLGGKCYHEGKLLSWTIFGWKCMTAAPSSPRLLVTAIQEVVPFFKEIRFNFRSKWRLLRSIRTTACQVMIMTLFIHIQEKPKKIVSACRWSCLSAESKLDNEANKRHKKCSSQRVFTILV